MGIHVETHGEVRKEMATEITGQPMANNFTQLEMELIAITAAISILEEETMDMQESLSKTQSTSS
jgi:hypothetical protein